MRIMLYLLETSPYPRLDIRDLCRPLWIVSFVVEGRVETETRGIHQIASAGDVMIHPPHVPFSERADGPGVHQWLSFQSARLGDEDSSGGGASSGSGGDEELLLRFPVPLVVPLGTERAARYTAQFRALETAWRERRARRDEPGIGDAETAEDVSAALRCESAAALLLADILEAWTESGKPPRPAEAAPPPPTRFAEIVRYLETHLHERITRDDLAARACLHPGSFDRAFRAEYGVAPLRLLHQLRLRKACRLLRRRAEENETLESVAQSCGFGDASRMGKAFRARFGVSPGAWRRAAASERRADETGIGYIPPLPADDPADYNNRQ